MKREDVYVVIETFLNIKDKSLIEKLTDQIHGEIMAKKSCSDNSDYGTCAHVIINPVNGSKPQCKICGKISV